MSKAALYAILDELDEYEEADVLQALKACRRTVTHRLSLADIIEHADNYRSIRRTRENQKRLDEKMDEWAKNSSPCPPDVKEQVRQLLKGKGM